MPNTITPDDDVAVTSAVASMRLHIASHAMRLLADSAKYPAVFSGPPDESRHDCTRAGHRLIPDDDELFVCVRCAKRFRQVA